jgi:hypothetical protein
LFVARIAADNEHNTATTHDFALVADTLNAGFNFHGGTHFGKGTTSAEAGPE